jgi:3-isopropylmalate/(R)-2-methylmalate dehydratase small subunit
MDPATQERFLGGLDDVGITMRHESAIDAFEATRPDWLAAR